MTSSSRQRQWSSEAFRLKTEASQALRPLHDDLQELTPAFDGLAYFAIDPWHKNNASEVASAQPLSDDTERFASYQATVAGRRVDLGATALGQALTLKEPTLLASRMHPDQHITWTQRMIAHNAVAGGLQLAFNRRYGVIPSNTSLIEAILAKHTPTTQSIAEEFKLLTDRSHSIGDSLELLAPATPNAFIVSWDLDKSTANAEHRYGTLRNYLIDTKQTFSSEISQLDTHTHDTGDGEDIAVWLPEGVDRANIESIRSFGGSAILPLLDRLTLAHDTLAREVYPDLSPNIHLAVGLGYIEQDIRGEHTSQEYWPIATLHKESINQQTTFTTNAFRALGPLLNKKHPQ